MIMDRYLNKASSLVEETSSEIAHCAHMKKSPRAPSFFLAVLYFRAWGFILTSHKAGIFLH
jgi:hypothetical protein